MNKRFMRFPEGKKKSVTLSYDDCMEEDADLIELLEKYQMKRSEEHTSELQSHA